MVVTPRAVEQAQSIGMADGPQREQGMVVVAPFSARMLTILMGRQEMCSAGHVACLAGSIVCTLVEELLPKLGEDEWGACLSDYLGTNPNNNHLKRA
jgi:hypothetical protein